MEPVRTDMPAERSEKAGDLAFELLCDIDTLLHTDGRYSVEGRYCDPDSWFVNRRELRLNWRGHRLAISVRVLRGEVPS
jgi:hypothetical protein